MQIAPGQLSLPSWRLLMGLEVLWLDVFGEDIFYRDLRGLYQLKKPVSLSIAYFATWGVYGSLVRPDPLLKKVIDMNSLWLKSSGGRVYQRGMNLYKFGTFLMKTVWVSFLLSHFLCIYTSLAWIFFLFVVSCDFCKHHSVQRNMLSSWGWKKRKWCYREVSIFTKWKWCFEHDPFGKSWFDWGEFFIFLGGWYTDGYIVLLGYPAFTGSVGCPYYLHKRFFFNFGSHILFFLMCFFTCDDSDVHFSDPSLCLTFFFISLMLDRYGPFR